MISEKFSSWAKGVKSFFRSYRSSTEEILANKITENEYFPYKMSHVGKFELKVRYSQFYVSIAGLAITILSIIIWIGLNWVIPNAINSVSLI
jgi:hypothetical protein